MFVKEMLLLLRYKLFCSKSRYGGRNLTNKANAKRGLACCPQDSYKQLAGNGFKLTGLALAGRQGVTTGLAYRGPGSLYTYTADRVTACITGDVITFHCNYRRQTAIFGGSEWEFKFAFSCFLVGVGASKLTFSWSVCSQLSEEVKYGYFKIFKKKKKKGFGTITWLKCPEIQLWLKMGAGDCVHGSNGNRIIVNPILTGGGGGVGGRQFDPPPCTKSATVSRPPLIATRFSWLFSFKSNASFDTKFAKIGPSVARSHNFLYSHVSSKFAQNLHFAYVCVQNTWKLLIFLKCSKSVFILSFWPLAQFLISWN